MQCACICKFGKKRVGRTKMSRSLVFLIVFLAAVIGAMFLLASLDVEQELKPVEKPVVAEESN